MPMQTTDQWGSLLPKGLGTDQEATQATSAMRQSPWYQDQLKQWEVTPEGDAYGNVKLNDDQQQQMYDLALKNGIGLNNKYDQIDENGQISEAHHKLRNGLIAAAIGGAAATGLGAAGIGPLSGLFGASAAPLASTTIGNGFIPAITGGTGMAAGAGTGAGLAAGAGSTMAGLLPSTGFVSPEVMMAPSSVSSMAGGAGATAAGGAGSIMSKILASLKKPANLADLSKLVQQGATDAQGNRVIQGNFAGQYDRNQLAAEAQRNDTESDTLKKLAQTGYLLDGHKGYSPASISMNGQTRTLPNFGSGFSAPSDAQKAGATTLQSQLMDRLKPGGTYTPMPFSNYGTPGTGEKIQSRVGEGLGIAGGVMNMFRKPDDTDSNYADIGKKFLTYFGNK